MLHGTRHGPAGPPQGWLRTPDSARPAMLPDPEGAQKTEGEEMRPRASVQSPWGRVRGAGVQASVIVLARKKEEKTTTLFFSSSHCRVLVCRTGVGQRIYSPNSGPSG